MSKKEDIKLFKPEDLEKILGAKTNVLNLNAIYDSLKEVQIKFDSINEQLDLKRDFLEDEIIENLMSAYHFLDGLYHDGIHRKKIVPYKHANALELNYRVHFNDELIGKRKEGRKFMESTKEKYYSRIQDAYDWYQKHEKAPWKSSSGLYIRILSKPQVFIEGNHRTGSLLVNMCLLNHGLAPFILTPKNALNFFTISTDIKFKKKYGKNFSNITNFTTNQERFIFFMKENSDKRFLI